LEKLGEGNSSVVHRAHDRRLNRDFAIKRINIYDKSKRHQIIKELHTLYKVRTESHRLQQLQTECSVRFHFVSG